MKNPPPQGDEPHYGAFDAMNITKIPNSVGTYEQVIPIDNAYAVSFYGTGRYFWTIAVVTTDPYQTISEEANPRVIYISVRGRGGNGNGGGIPRPPVTPTRIGD